MKAEPRIDFSKTRSDDWNTFWRMDQAERFTKVSWSKRRMLRILEPYCDSGKKVIDAGCGSGFFSKYFCDRGLRTFSLDYADQALTMTERVTEGKTQLLKLDLLADPLAQRLPENVDLIFSDGLLEHFSLEDQNRIMRNLISVLTGGGHLITFVPNRFSPWELIRPFYMPGIEERPFVLKELVNLSRQNELTVIAKGGLNTFPFLFSPDAWLGNLFGMLLFTVSEKND